MTDSCSCFSGLSQLCGGISGPGSVLGSGLPASDSPKSPNSMPKIPPLSLENLSNQNSPILNQNPIQRLISTPRDDQNLNQNLNYSNVQELPSQQLLSHIDESQDGALTANSESKSNSNVNFGDVLSRVNSDQNHEGHSDSGPTSKTLVYDSSSTTVASMTQQQSHNDVMSAVQTDSQTQSQTGNNNTTAFNLLRRGDNTKLSDIERNPNSNFKAEAQIQPRIIAGGPVTQLQVNQPIPANKNQYLLQFQAPKIVAPQLMQGVTGLTPRNLVNNAGNNKNQIQQLPQQAQKLQNGPIPGRLLPNNSKVTSQTTVTTQQQQQVPANPLIQRYPHISSLPQPHQSLFYTAIQDSQLSLLSLPGGINCQEIQWLSDPSILSIYVDARRTLEDRIDILRPAMHWRIQQRDLLDENNLKCPKCHANEINKPLKLDPEAYLSHDARCFGLDYEGDPVFMNCFQLPRNLDPEGIANHMTCLFERTLRKYGKEVTFNNSDLNSMSSDTNASNGVKGITRGMAGSTIDIMSQPNEGQLNSSNSFNTSSKWTQWVWIIDLYGFGLKHCDPRTSLKLLHLLQTAYRGRLKKCLVLNPPMLFDRMWDAAIKPFVKEKTREAIEFKQWIEGDNNGGNCKRVIREIICGKLPGTGSNSNSSNNSINVYNRLIREIEENQDDNFVKTKKWTTFWADND